MAATSGGGGETTCVGSASEGSDCDGGGDGGSGGDSNGEGTARSVKVLGCWMVSECNPLLLVLLAVLLFVFDAASFICSLLPPLPLLLPLPPLLLLLPPLTWMLPPLPLPL